MQILMHPSRSPVAVWLFLVCHSDAKDATQGHVCGRTQQKHSQTPSPVRRTFEWQLGGMTVSDCGDNGILVSLQIVPQEMAENCFWIKVKEEKFENPDLFAQLSLCFSSQSKGKEASSFSTPSLINQQTYASFGVFSHLKRNCLDTTTTVSVWSQFKSLCQLCIPMLVFHCVYVSMRKLKCQVAPFCICCLYPLSSFISVVFIFVCVDVHKPELVHICVNQERPCLVWFLPFPVQ